MTDAVIEELLAAWRSGDEQARNELISRFHRELTQLAEKVLRRERRGRQLSIATGDLVNETVARLLRTNNIAAADRSHLMALSATVMRQFLVDRARAKKSAKRKGLKVTFNEASIVDPTDEAGMLELNDALEALRQVDARRADMFEYHYFVGMTHEEIATVVGLSRSTVRRHCIAAAEYLRERLDNDD
ncbi:MAG: ECF-type sigma factor [Woeseiaceae bacterium]|nr:ECF-type sigma factor [Woeseiaceae bacterium]